VHKKLAWLYARANDEKFQTPAQENEKFQMKVKEYEKELK